MRDPISWSFPLGRMFGVTVRIHILFVIFFLGSVLRVAFAPEDPTHVIAKLPDGAWIDILVILILLFLSVLAHEFGHVFGARCGRRRLSGDPDVAAGRVGLRGRAAHAAGQLHQHRRRPGRQPLPVRPLYAACCWWSTVRRFSRTGGGPTAPTSADSTPPAMSCCTPGTTPISS